MSHCGFDLHFPDESEVEHLFRYLLAICVSSLKNICSGPLPIFQWDYLGFSLLICRSSLYILDVNTLSGIWYLINIFFPFPRLPLYFADGFLCYAEAFQFDIVAFVIFF